MDDKPFSQAIEVKFAGGTRVVSTTREAVDLLTAHWPGKNDDARQEALDTCLKVLDGHRSTIDAENALKAAVAGLQRG